ncbi:MAG: hypothetical protein HQL30_12585 [Candidatus Omnitrophica bacterium]|nr:hypothetical protein [Candidatus Omnitrophota bacterium]
MADIKERTVMEQEPSQIEDEANTLLVEEKYAQAHDLFKKAGSLYRSRRNHRQAALCFASAASCWGIKCGEKTYSESAHLFADAAKEAEAHFDYEYAATLYKQAAMYYERDGEFTNFAECFYESKESTRRSLGYLLLKSRKHRLSMGGGGFGDFVAAAKLFLKWSLLTASYLIWGHGEKPMRTLMVSLSLIFGASFLYSFCLLAKHGVPFHPTYFDALYLSTVTFATIGYGDITPLGIGKLIAMTEAFGSMFLLPLFLVGFSRKYLRF